MVSFFLPMKLQVITCIACCLYFIVSCIKANDKYPRRLFITATLCGSLYLLYLAAIPFTPKAYQNTIHTLWETRVSLLLFPLVLGYVSRRYGKMLINALPIFAISCVLVCIAGNIAFIIAYLNPRLTPIPLNHVAYRVYFETFTGVHPTYMSMYLVFSICILLLHAKSLRKTLRYALLYLSIGCLLPLLAKSPLVALILIALHQLWRRRLHLGKYKWAFIGCALLMAIGWFKIPFVSQRVLEMITPAAGKAVGNVIDNSILARKLILTVDTEVLKDYWLTGTGPGRMLYVLKTHFLFHSIYYGFNTNSYDPHNAYFYEWISFGILGLMVLLGTIAFYYWNALRQRNFLFIYLLIILYITFLTESVLATQHGIMFYAFFCSLFLFVNARDKQMK